MGITKTNAELTKEEEKEILEKKMIYYAVSGALVQKQLMVRNGDVGVK